MNRPGMDPVGAVLNTALEVYVQSARRSGRTTRMIEGLSDGDIVIFQDNREKERVSRLIRETRPKLNVKLIAIPADRPELLRGLRAPNRLRFDHLWIEAWHRYSVERASREISFFEERMSDKLATYRDFEFKPFPKEPL